MTNYTGITLYFFIHFVSRIEILKYRYISFHKLYLWRLNSYYYFICSDFKPGCPRIDQAQRYPLPVVTARQVKKGAVNPYSETVSVEHRSVMVCIPQKRWRQSNVLFINFIKSKLNVWGHTEVTQNNSKGGNSIYIQSNYKVLTQY